MGHVVHARTHVIMIGYMRIEQILKRFNDYMHRADAENKRAKYLQTPDHRKLKYFTSTSIIILKIQLENSKFEL
jgi:hypothetical protein